MLLRLSAASTRLSFVPIMRGSPVCRTLATTVLPSPFKRAKRIVLIRHGESEGNVDEAAYVNTADWYVCCARGSTKAHSPLTLQGLIV